MGRRLFLRLDGADYRSPEPAAQEAKMHRHSQRQPWSLETVEPWSPSKHPFSGARP
jgi:hypothetical protein